MRHADVLLLAVGELDDGDAIGDSVLAFGHNLDNCSIALGWSHDDMLMEKVIFENVTDLITASDDGARALVVVRHESVLTILVEGGEIDTTGHEHRSGDLSDRLQGSLNSVEDSLENTYTTDYN